MVTQADIDNLNAAIASGARAVTIGDQSVTYNTTASLIAARDDMTRQLAAQDAKAAGRVRPRETLIRYAGRGH